MKITNICEIVSGEIVEIHFRDHQEVAELLTHFRTYFDLSWPKIAQIPAINPPDDDPIPIATLASIEKTKVVPKKWRHRFPGVGAIDSRKRISISKNDMKKAERTIYRNIERDKVVELVGRLRRRLESDQ